MICRRGASQYRVVWRLRPLPFPLAISLRRVRGCRLPRSSRSGRSSTAGVSGSSRRAAGGRANACACRHCLPPCCSGGWLRCTSPTTCTSNTSPAGTFTGFAFTTGAWRQRSPQWRPLRRSLPCGARGERSHPSLRCRPSRWVSHTRCGPSTTQRSHLAMHG